MKRLLTLLLGALCVFTLSAQVNLVSNRNFKKEAQVKTNRDKIQPAISDDIIADGYCRIVLTAGDLWGDGTGYQMLITSNEEAIDAFLNSDQTQDFGADIYNMFEYKIPTNADGALNSTNVVFESSAQIDIPAGHYYFLFPSPGGDRMYIAEGYAFSWTFEEKATYSFKIVLGSEGDAVELDVFAYGFPAEISDLIATPAEDESLACLLSWTNPSLDVMGAPLDDLKSVTIKRNGEIIHTVQNPVIGAADSWTDNPPVDGLYTYSIYATSSTRNGPEFTAGAVYVGIDPCQFPISEFPLYEDFESGTIPYCWQVIDNDNDGKGGWEIFSSWIYEGAYSIRHRDYFGEQDNWFVMQQVSIPQDGNYALRFFDFTAMPAWYVKSSVWVSEGSADPASGDFVEVWAVQEPLEEWKQQTILLEKYAGKDIYIAFRYEGNFAHYWYLDNVTIEDFDLLDVELFSIISPTTGLDLGEETVTIKIKNNGSEPIANAKITIFVDEVQQLEETITKEIPALSEYTYTFNGKLDLSRVKIYNIKAIVDTAGDMVEGNNTQSKTVRNYGPVAVMGMVAEMTTCDIEFFDDGVYENYSPDIDKEQIITFFPAETGKRLCVEFGLIDLGEGDVLYIYEGETIETEHLIASLNSTSHVEEAITFYSYSSDGVLTFLFYKAGFGNTGEGWEAVVKCYTPAPKEVGLVEILSPVKGGNSEAEVSVRVRNYGAETIATLPVAYSFNNATAVVEYAEVNLAPGLSTEYTFTAKIDLGEYSDNYELKAYTMLEGDADPANDSKHIEIFYRPSVELFGFLSYYPSERVSFESNTPRQITKLNDYNLGMGYFPFGVFYFDKHIYVAVVDAGYNPMFTRSLIKYNTDWSEVSRVSINVQVPVVDLTYDYLTKKVYATTMNTATMVSELYTIDPQTGAMELVAPMNDYIGGIASNPEGELYGITTGGMLVQIDKATGEFTDVHQLNISNAAKGFNSLNFDLESGRLFYNNFPGAGFCEIDLESGRVQVSGYVGQGVYNYVGMYIPYDEDEVSLPEIAGTGFLIYPNPTDGVVNIPSLSGNAQITLRDIAGKVIDIRYSNGSTRQEYDVPAGVYLIEVKCEGNTFNQKLIVK